MAARSGHFRLESGHHTDRWLDLERLFIEPAMLRPFVEKLAGKLSAHRPDLICGPMTGGALLAELIADHLGTRFAFAQRTIDNGRAQYSIPKSLRDVLNDVGCRPVPALPRRAALRRALATDLVIELDLPAPFLSILGVPPGSEDSGFSAGKDHHATDVVG